MKKTDQNQLAMREAHVQGDLETVRKLLDAHPELEKMGYDVKHSPWFHLATEHGQVGLIEFWLDRGWDVNYDSPGGSKSNGVFTAMHIAKDAATTRYLLSRGALVNVYHRELGTPLHYAVFRAFEPSQKGRRRPEGANLDQIRALLDAGADLTLMSGEDKEGHTPLSYAIYLRRKSAEKLLREVGAPEKGRWPLGLRPQKTKLDLQKDFKTVYDYLANRIRNFDPATYAGLGGPGKVKMIHLEFDFIHQGWINVDLDTRPDADTDGESSDDFDDHLLEMPHWKQALETVEAGEQPLKLVNVDGSKSTVSTYTDFVNTLGDMLKTVLLQARENGMYATLAKAPGCELIVDHFDGEYFWPESDEATRTENLA